MNPLEKYSIEQLETMRDVFPEFTVPAQLELERRLFHDSVQTEDIQRIEGQQELFAEEKEPLIKRVARFLIEKTT